MSSFNVQEGEQLILKATLPLQDASKFVRAFVTDENGVALSGSPFDLNNLGDGVYFFKDPSLVMPIGAIEVTARYVLFDDAAYTQLHEGTFSQQAQDTFRLLNVEIDSLQDSVNETLDKVDNLLKNIITLQDDLEVAFDDDDEPIEVTISDD